MTSMPVPHVPAMPAASAKQLATVVLRIREMILRGELAPGERVRETEIAERLNLSRTPVRQALPALAQEGLLVASGRRGYAVRTFSSHEIMEAIELRAVMEGLAARSMAERGAPEALLAALRACLAEGDAIFAKRTIEQEDEPRYGTMNDRFHRLILEGAGRPLLIAFAQRCNIVPFVSPLNLAFQQRGVDGMFQILFFAHQQHHAIVDAISSRDGARAEFLFREHAVMQKNSINLDLTWEDWRPA